MTMDSLVSMKEFLTSFDRFTGVIFTEAEPTGTLGD